MSTITIVISGRGHGQMKRHLIYEDRLVRRFTGGRWQGKPVPENFPMTRFEIYTYVTMGPEVALKTIAKNRGWPLERALELLKACRGEPKWEDIRKLTLEEGR